MRVSSRMPQPERHLDLEMATGSVNLEVSQRLQQF